MKENSFLRPGGVRDVETFRGHLRRLDLSIPCDEEVIGGGTPPLARPNRPGGTHIGNRFAVHPMDGWDGTRGGEPSELTFRRRRNFGASGAKLIWGGEAAAVRHDGRALKAARLAAPAPSGPSSSQACASPVRMCGAPWPSRFIPEERPNTRTIESYFSTHTPHHRPHLQSRR